MPRSSSACSALRTMLTRLMPSFWQILFSIWPRLLAAAVCTRAVWPSRFMVSTMPSAVSGLTKHDAPSAAVASAGSTRHWPAGMARYWAYMAPPITATVLPSSACAAGDAPAATTRPAPSLPTGRLWPRRAAMAGMARSGMGAVATGRSAVPPTASAARLPAPNSRPMSDGLIGVACTWISTSSGPGVGTGTDSRCTVRVASGCTVERSCRAVAGIVMVSPGGVGGRVRACTRAGPCLRTARPSRRRWRRRRCA